jgi:hypothetical protein
MIARDVYLYASLGVLAFGIARHAGASVGLWYAPSLPHWGIAAIFAAIFWLVWAASRDRGGRP